MPIPVKRNMAGWGNYPKQSCYAFRPKSMSDLTRIIQADTYSSHIVHGLGRSYGDTSLNEQNGVIHFDQFNHMLHFNEASMQLTCEAGVSLAEIIDVFLPRGYYLPVTPGTKFVTVGGAIANDIHGKNHHVDGCFTEFVLSFDLLTATNDVITCSREEHADVFWATIGGIGLTGIILRATIQLIPVDNAYINVTYEKAKNLTEAFDKFVQNDQNYKYSVAWIDCLATGDSLGRSVLMRGDHAKQSDLPASVTNPLVHTNKWKVKMPIYAPSLALNYWSVSAFNKLYYASFTNETKLVDATSFFHPLDGIGDWNKLYGKKGFIQYQAVFPKANSPETGLRKVLEKLSAAKRSSFLAILKSSGPANKGLLSFLEEGYTLALDIPIKNNKLFSFLKDLDKIVLAHGGRVYLAKDATIDPNTFKQMYPNWEQFQQIKQELDPNDRFSSSMSRRLGLTPRR